MKEILDPLGSEEAEAICATLRGMTPEQRAVVHDFVRFVASIDPAAAPKAPRQASRRPKLRIVR
jgi:hypothetical protein